jgi:hypothetical protein
MTDLVYRLRKRAEIRRQIDTRKSVQEGKPDRIADLLEEAADLIEQAQQVNKEGSPCPEFWDWLPKAYNFEGDGAFTKYNMEVAFLAGKQSVEQAQPEANERSEVEPVAWMRDDEMKAMVSDEKRAWILCGQLELINDYNKPLYTSPQVAEPQPQRQPLVIDSKEKASEFIEKTLWEVIDVAAMFPKAKPDPRTWEHLMAYAPQRQPLKLDELWRVFTRSGLSQFHQRDGVVEYKYERCIEEFARAIEAAHGITGEHK